MKYFPFSFVLLSIGFLPFLAEASVPHIVDIEFESDVVVVQDPELSQAFYGTLGHFPHTYEIVASEPFVLTTEILVPDIDSSENIFSGIIIKFPEEGRGRVTEIDRLDAYEAEWVSKFDRVVGERHRHGPLFQKELESGVYHIQVHTPDNVGKYVLLLGEKKERNIGYFELVGRLIEVKRFFEKPAILVIQSPYVYIPLIIITLLIGIYWLRRTTIVHKNINSDIV